MLWDFRVTERVKGLKVESGSLWHSFQKMSLMMELDKSDLIVLGISALILFSQEYLPFF